MRPKIALLLSVAGPLAVGPVRAAQLEAVASVEAGVAACSLSSLPLPDGGVGGYNVPSGTTFVGCGFSGDSGLDDQTAASGPLAASGSAGDVQFAGAAQAQADYGPLSAAASGTSTRSGNFTGNAAAAFASFTDVLTATSASIANGSPGWVIFHFAIAGQIDVENAVELIGSQAPTLLPPVLSGFTNTLGTTGWTVAGSGASATSKLPISFGTPFSTTVTLLAEAFPQTQSLASGSADVSFLSGATLIGFEFIDALQQPIGDVVVTAESGTQYVPEPSSELLALASAAAVALLRQRRREATSS